MPEICNSIRTWHRDAKAEVFARYEYLKFAPQNVHVCGSCLVKAINSTDVTKITVIYTAVKLPF